MTNERRKQIDRVYSAALEVEKKERSLFIEQACGGDAELSWEVESRLRLREHEDVSQKTETLGERLNRGPLPLEELLRATIEIATALDKAHRRGEVHGDLNPDNILLSKDGLGSPDRPCSVSLLTPSPTLQAPSPPTGTRELTPIVHSTQAPEQLQGQQADARTDIFALGAVMYEMAKGRKAFGGESPATLAMAILTSEPPAMTTIQSSTPPELERVIKTCLAKDPEERWQTARDLVRELEWIADAYPQSLSAREAARRQKKERLSWVLAAIFLLALGLVLGILFYPRRRPPVQTGLKRFVLPPGNPSRPGDGFDISPDGQQLVLASGGFLWLRPISSLNAQRLVGTGSGGGFCWSQDSRFIVVVKERRLLKVDPKGGEPQLIYEFPGNTFMGGVVCNREGIVLFRTKNRIWKVSADGRTPSPVTELDPRHKEAHAAPSFLPDGRHFLYVVVRKDQVWINLEPAEVRTAASPPDGDAPERPQTSGIYVGSLDSKETRHLLDIETPVVYAEPGYLLYQSQGRLLAHPFDAKRLSLTGDPIPIVEDLFVRAPLNFAWFAASDTGTLFYVGGSRMRRQLTRVDRNGRTVETIGPPGDAYNFELSPDGKQVALEEGTETQAAHIWTMDLQTGRKTQVTNSVKAWNYVPCWSADGRQIVFSSNRDQGDPGGSGGNLYVSEIAKGTGGETALLKDSQYKWTSEWSPDERYFLYHNVQSLSPLQSSLWLLPLFGERKPAPLLESAVDGRFSPNGCWIAYMSMVSTDKWDIIVRAFPLSQKRWQISTRNAFHPLWRKDGKELFYLEHGDKAAKLMSVAVKAGSGSNDTFEASPPKPLFEVATGWPGVPSRYGYAASPDGQSFYVFGEANTNIQLHVVLNWTELLPKE
jgi:dipeptidyl aminopeptidase/acylaminoacyl peptidase